MENPDLDSTSGPSTGLTELNSASGACPRVNVGVVERYVSLILGSLLVLKLFKHRNLFGLILAGLGVLACNRGLSGHCPLYQDLEIDRDDKK